MLDFRRHIGQLNIIERGDDLQNVGQWYAQCRLAPHRHAECTALHHRADRRDQQTDTVITRSRRGPTVDVINKAVTHQRHTNGRDHGNRFAGWWQNDKPGACRALPELCHETGEIADISFRGEQHCPKAMFGHDCLCGGAAGCIFAVVKAAGRRCTLTLHGSGFRK